MAKIVMPLGPDFEDSEFRKPYDALIAAGHEVTIVGAEVDKIVTGKRRIETATIEATADQLDAEDFDAMVIPGGFSPDRLRLDEELVQFVRKFDTLKRPIAAVCHGPQLLIEADAVRGRRLTSWPSVRKDLENAGAHWVDARVCEDGHLITSRKPEDLEAFNAALLSRLAA